MTALEVTDLAVRLGGRQVLRDLNLSIDRGEFVGLIGPNGAGKTTLLRSILGLQKTERGSARVSGGRPGYVPQRHEFAWDFPITVEDVVMSGLVRKIGWLRGPTVSHFEAVMDALIRVELDHLARRPVAELSGGQRQRVLVARALALNPSVLLLDEPFTGLDLPTQELLSKLFARLAEEGHAVLMTTHDLIGAMHDCSRLCLLNRTIIADGAPRELGNAAVWQRAFGVGDEHPLLTALTAVAAKLAETEATEATDAGAHNQAGRATDQDASESVDATQKAGAGTC